MLKCSVAREEQLRGLEVTFQVDIRHFVLRSAYQHAKTCPIVMLMGVLFVLMEEAQAGEDQKSGCHRRHLLTEKTISIPHVNKDSTHRLVVLPSTTPNSVASDHG